MRYWLRGEYIRKRRASIEVATGAMVGVLVTCLFSGAWKWKGKVEVKPPPPPPPIDQNVSRALRDIYNDQILPVEVGQQYQVFHSEPIHNAEFFAKPLVLIVGQYSVGKTSFVRSLIEKDFPGQRVGPEPTTDRFMVVSYGKIEQLVPGQALTMLDHQPFRGLQQFGNSFLAKLEGSMVDAPFLKDINLVDTPGVLSGEKQRVNRNYDFSAAVSWFAERADMIVMMFDAHKTDISDEFKSAITTLQPHQDKIRILLNKADAVETRQLMRVYGALMWSLGKVLHTPEVPRVYIGSFSDDPLQHRDHKALLEKEKQDFLRDLRGLPKRSSLRRINELAKRARSVKVHAYIIVYLQEHLPTFIGRKRKQDELVRHLDHHFDLCARRYSLARADFPEAKRFGRLWTNYGDISKIKIDTDQVEKMDDVFSHYVPKLMKAAKELYD